MKNSYGQALGKLVLKKRRILGLTQIQLSEDAYSDGKKVRKISELENGLVGNPHPKTIDPLINVLGITKGELEQCADISQDSPDETLQVAYREASELIQMLANRFEYSNPDASLQDLNMYLIGKAHEFLELREKLSKLDAIEDDIGNLRDQAISCLEAGNFEDVDEFLEQAEHKQLLTQTLKHIGKQAELRVLRGDSKVLEGQWDTAYGHYEAAALYFELFDKSEMFDAFQNLGRRLYELGRRSSSQQDAIFLIPERLLKKALEFVKPEMDHEIYASVCFRLSLVLRNRSQMHKRPRQVELLVEGQSFIRESIKANARNGDSYRQASAQTSLANLLFDLSKVTEDPTVLTQAISVYMEARDLLLRLETHVELLPHIYNGLGSALNSAFNIADEREDIKDLEGAKIAYEKAIDISERCGDVEVWGVANLNAGSVILRLAEVNELEGSRYFLTRLKAISYFTAAIETFPAASFPRQFSQAHLNLSDVLITHALQEQSELKELYLARAMASLEQVKHLRVNEDDPETLGLVDFKMGSIFGNHSRMAESEVAETDILSAIECFKEAETIYGNLGKFDVVSACQNNINMLNEDLGKIKNGQPLEAVDES